MTPTPEARKRAAWFAGGRCTVGTISTVNQTRHTFHNWFVGKVRSKVVMHPKTGRYKFSDRNEAMECAQAFQTHCAEVSR